MIDVNTIPVSLIYHYEEISDFINDFARSKQESKESVTNSFDLGLSGLYEISIYIDAKNKIIRGSLRDGMEIPVTKEESYVDTDQVRLPDTALKSRGVTKGFQRELEVLADVINYLLGKYAEIIES